MLVDGSVCEKLVLKCFRVVVGHVEEKKKVMLKCLWVDKLWIVLCRWCVQMTSKHFLLAWRQGRRHDWRDCSITVNEVSLSATHTRAPPACFYLVVSWVMMDHSVSHSAHKLYSSYISTSSLMHSCCCMFCWHDCNI